MEKGIKKWYYFILLVIFCSGLIGTAYAQDNNSVSVQTDNVSLKWCSECSSSDPDDGTLDYVEPGSSVVPKDVGNTLCWVNEETGELQVRINNAYPGYQVLIEACLANVGKIPVQIKQVEVTGQKDNVEAYFIESGEYGEILDRCVAQNENVPVALKLRVSDDVQPGQMYNIEITINGNQVSSDEDNGDVVVKRKKSKGGSEPDEPELPDELEEPLPDEPDPELPPEEVEPSPEEPAGSPELEELIGDGPEIDISKTSLDLPYTGGNRWLFIGAGVSLIGIGVWLRRKGTGNKSS